MKLESARFLPNEPKTKGHDKRKRRGSVLQKKKRSLLAHLLMQLSQSAASELKLTADENERKKKTQSLKSPDGLMEGKCAS